MKMNPENREELDRLHDYLDANQHSLHVINQVAFQLLQKSYPLGKALQAYDNYLALQPASSSATFNHAWYLARDGQFEAAVRKYRQALELGIGQPEEVNLNIGNIYMDHLREHDKAREAFQRALSINPRYAGAYHNLGNLAEQLGDREQAASYFGKCLEFDPGNELALARLADAHRFTDSDEPLLARLTEAARTSTSSDLHFALGAAYNQLANYELAWRSFSTANALDKKNLPAYNREKAEAYFERILSQCGRQWFEKMEDSYAGGDPVFICGMFRTGSTLLEQVLAAHPHFTAGGEREFFPRLVHREFHDFPEGLEKITVEEFQTWRAQSESHASRITGASTRLTDKRPDNFLYVGLIKAIVPSAKFIVTERDWRDVALSIFSTRLGATQTYSTDLADIRHYIGLQKGLVDHWESILGDDLLRVSYEDMVGLPRETIEKLLQDLGEDWDERCLNFDQLDNPVKTASVWQVREPLHARSIGRWRNYQAYFEEVFAAESLQDC